ncbi:MAG: ParB/RepB/Spo0J family partition protein [Bacilli bacterium]|nr:ParB/RepB/Spo0J family partition protein [Bacilli bacterium]
MNTESQVLNVPIEDIIPNRFQPRLNFDENGLKELAASIKEHGIIQPLVLRRLGDKYEIIAGERRYKASKLAGLTSVPAIISALDDQKSAEVAIVENVQRRDLSSIEEAKSYKALLDKGYLTQEELAKKMGLSQSAISNKLRLLSLANGVQNALMEGKISERHARSLLQVDDLEEQEKWLETIIEERLTVRELDKRLKGRTKDDKKVEIPITEVPPKVENVTPVVEIPPVPQFEDIIPTNKNTSSSSIPNKFFNYLEDESANMSIEETVATSPVEEIEMLDFLAPVENNKKDMSIATNLLDKLASELTNNNYQINVIKDENTEELKYTITIKKED